ncbi:MAG TPA: lipopolysaccharide kinase InaA family protein [Candidatus Binatia bacterium]|jgi:serine/threonine protein kinase
MTAELRGEGAGEYKFVSAADGLAGWVRKELPENLFAELIRDPDSLLNHPSSLTVKDGHKTKVVRHIFHDGRGVTLNVIVKRFQYKTGLRRLRFFFFPSPALRSLRGALLLQSKGVLVARPLAALEYRDWKKLGTSYYVSEEVGDSRSLKDLWPAFVRTLPRKKRPGLRRALLRDLARLLARLHSMNIYHRDLKNSNILIQGWAGDERRLFLVDLDRVEERPRLSISKRVKNLLQVRRRGPFPKEQIYFFMRYAEGCCPSKKNAKALVRRILARSRRTEAWLQRKPKRSIQGP